VVIAGPRRWRWGPQAPGQLRKVGHALRLGQVPKALTRGRCRRPALCESRQEDRNCVHWELARMSRGTDVNFLLENAPADLGKQKC